MYKMDSGNVGHELRTRYYLNVLLPLHPPKRFQRSYLEIPPLYERRDNLSSNRVIDSNWEIDGEGDLDSAPDESK